MQNNPNWKKGQERVKKEFTKFMGSRKNFWFKEFADTYQAQGNFIQEQPSDMWFLYRGQFGILEIKTNEQARFPFKDIQPSQIAGATRAIACGAVSVFLICKLPEWQWYYVDGQEILDRRRNQEKSMLWSDMTPINLKAEELFNELLGM